jgi:small conductance mechanosensitive channel
MAETLTAIEQVKSTAIDLALRFGPKFLTALAVFIAGVVISRWAAHLLTRGLERIELEPPVRSLLARIARGAVLCLFGMMALQNIGVELLPLLAGLGVVGAGVALAMQGLLSDVAAGLSIIFSKPFRVGEYISVAEEEGEVRDISLFSTVLAHPDGWRVVIPNRKIVGEVFRNHGMIRQLNLSVGVAYDTNIDAAIAAIENVVTSHPRVLRDPRPLVHPVQLTDFSVQLSVQICVAVSDYVSMQGEIYKAILAICRERGIVIPFPRHDVQLLGSSALLRDVQEESRLFAESA